MNMNQIETQDELTNKKGNKALIDIWRREIDNAKKYHEESKKTAKDFQAIYDRQDKDNTIHNTYPIFWSNTQVMKPLLFSKLPKINIAQANYNDNEIARISSELIERLLNYLLKESDAENQIEKIRDAFLIQGIGIPRIVFIPPEPIEIKTKIKKKIKIEKPKIENGEEENRGKNENETSSKDKIGRAHV